MCDYSLMHAKSRPAIQGEKLITKNFGRGTRGFASVLDAQATPDTSTAICVLPGTELAFDAPPRVYGVVEALSTTARFRQIDTDNTSTHHDALEFVDGTVIKLTRFSEDQEVSVLQLPAAPANETERKAQLRIPITESQFG